MIPFSPPYVDQTVIDEVVSSLNSGWITTGPKVYALEEEIAKFTGVNKVLCINSWTSGAIMMLKWFGVGAGDEVIVPAYTYSATALAVLHCGAKPVMVDVNTDFSINIEAIRESITKRTKVIIPVDIAGWPCDYDSMLSLASDHSIRKLFHASNDIQSKLNRILVLADSAHSFGAIFNNKKISNADISIFSLHAVKNLTTAEGGAICLNLPEPFDNPELYKFLRIMSLNGQTKDAFSKSQAGGWRYDIIMQGMKINMPDICAAVGLAQIRIYPKLLEERKRIFLRYSEHFAKYSWAQLPPFENQQQTSSCHLYALRFIGVNEKQRDQIIEEISKKEVAVNVHFLPMPMLTLFKELGYKISDYPVAYDNYSRELSLPIYPQLTNSQVDYVAESVTSSYEKVMLK